MKYISTISHFCDIVVVEKMSKQNATLKIVSTQCGLLAAFLLLAKAPLASKAAYSSKPRASVLSRTQFGKSSNIAKLDAYTSRKWEVTTEHTESFLSGSLSFLCQFFLLLKCTLRTVNDVPKVLTIRTVNDGLEKRTPWKDPSKPLKTLWDIIDGPQCTGNL